MARYAFHDLTLEVEGRGARGRRRSRSDPRRALVGENEASRPEDPRFLSRFVSGKGRIRLPSTAREVLGATAFAAWRTKDEFYLTDGAPSFVSSPGRAEARPGSRRRSFEAVSLAAELLGLRPAQAPAAARDLRSPRGGSRRGGRDGGARRRASPAAASPRSRSLSSAAAGATSPTTPCCCAPGRTASRRWRSGGTSTSSARRPAITRTCRSGRRDRTRAEVSAGGSASKRPTRSSAFAACTPRVAPLPSRDAQTSTAP